MSTITVTLEWFDDTLAIGGNGYGRMGWRVKICGSDVATAIDFSPHNFEVAKTGPYQVIWNGNKREKVANGPLGWVLSPVRERSFDKKYGATQVELPIGQVTEYLGALQKMSYNIVASQSLATGEHAFPILVWTLQSQIA